MARIHFSILGMLPGVRGKGGCDGGGGGGDLLKQTHGANSQP